MSASSILTLGKLSFHIEETPPQGLLTRWRKNRRRVVVSDAQRSLGFLYQEVIALLVGPILVEG